MKNSKNPTPAAKKIILKLHPRGKYFQKLRENKNWDRNYGKQQEPYPWGKKNHSKTPPTGQIFSKIKGKQQKLGQKLWKTVRTLPLGQKKSF